MRTEETTERSSEQPAAETCEAVCPQRAPDGPDENAVSAGWLSEALPAASAVLIPEQSAGEQSPGERSDEESPSEENASEEGKPLTAVYDLFELFGFMTVAVMIMFAFFVRLNVVEGSSMRRTLTDGDYLAVSCFGYEPYRGDIVIIHRIDADPYDRPIVKRVIAVGGQTVDIDFDTWTLTVDGEIVGESYRWLDETRELLRSEVSFPLTLGEDEIFVMGDNRNGSADSRQAEIGPVDVRCVVGRAFCRVSPDFMLFANPFRSDES